MSNSMRRVLVACLLVACALGASGRDLSAFSRTLSAATYREGELETDCGIQGDILPTRVVPIDATYSDYYDRVGNGFLASGAGRLEVYCQYRDGAYNPQWGGITTNLFMSSEDGRAACASLGFPADTPDIFEATGAGTVVLDQLGCSGNEDSLHECQHVGFFGCESTTCSPNTVVGVKCRAHDCTPTIQNGDIRLVGNTGAGSNNEGHNVGRVEVYYGGVWGTVNANTNNEAAVACRQLGYDGGVLSTAATSATWGVPIWLSNLSCTGYEHRIAHCMDGTQEDWGVNASASHSDDLVVECDTSSGWGLPTYSSDINLPSSGQVKVKDMPGQTGGHAHICFNGVSVDTADTMCRQLGYSQLKKLDYYEKSSNGRNAAKVIEGIVCSGGEENIDDCVPMGSAEDNYKIKECVDGESKNKLVEMSCQAESLSAGCETVPTIGDVRLVGGADLGKGRLEIFYAGEWGTVCSYSVGEHEANMFCRALGLGYTYATYNGNKYGGGTGTIWVDGLSCASDADHITDCSFDGWAVTSCSHTEDVSLECS